MKILFFGDIVGKPGRKAVAAILPKLREEHKPDLVIANAENLAHGKGITLSTINFMLDAGIDFFTSGNHIFDKPEAKAVFEKYPDKIIRPANLSSASDSPVEMPMPAPIFGDGWKVITVRNQPILMINLLGEVFMDKQFDFGSITSPFLKLNEILSEAGGLAKIRFVDFHAEATSEKRGMGFWADGRVSALVGTHTHVQTADAQVLPQGTGYITDTGMSGAAQSIIGVDATTALQRFTAPPDAGKRVALEIPEGQGDEVGYVVMEIDEETGKCQNINSFLQML